MNLVHVKINNLNKMALEVSIDNLHSPESATAADNEEEIELYTFYWK